MPALPALAACIVAAFASGCDNSIGITEVLPPLETASLDPDAGTWSMILLSGPTQFAVAAPSEVTSSEYATELEGIRLAQSRLTPGQRQVIAYWSGGGMLRWNQIARELVAQFNLPPAPASNGGYPVPDADNPFGDPNFPFANPAYAARAYSYLSAAQYDALKAAWYWKYQFNRLSPASNDTSIAALMPISGLPSYPSEDAVLSAVAAEILKAMFPAAVEKITLKAAEQRQAALWAGRAAASDIAAGLALGRSVAAAFLSRAATDGMRNAGGSSLLWQQLADSAAAHGEIPWRSLESPPRPPMLPNFGQVMAWRMTPAEIVTERMPAPPSTSSQEMQAEVAEVRRVVDNLTREQLSIAFKWNDGAGTYTPPGHWNDIAAEYVRDARMSEVRAARTFALLNMAMHDAAVNCWNTKFFYFNPRPSQLDPGIRTPIGLPNFPSYSSGHSTFSAAAALVLSEIFPGASSTFAAMRDEAAISRLYGGIHYRSDIEAGKAHGARIAAYTLRFAALDGAN